MAKDPRCCFYLSRAWALKTEVTFGACARKSTVLSQLLALYLRLLCLFRTAKSQVRRASLSNNTAKRFRLRACDKYVRSSIGFGQRAGHSTGSPLTRTFHVPHSYCCNLLFVVINRRAKRADCIYLTQYLPQGWTTPGPMLHQVIFWQGY